MILRTQSTRTNCSVKKLNHKFVEFIPDALNEGILYVSVTHGTSVHRCCCGCGREVVTPLTPADWRMIFDGETVSLYPSIGNWNFPCRSHYWISENRVEWVPRWNEERDEEKVNDDSEGGCPSVDCTEKGLWPTIKRRWMQWRNH